MNRHPTWQYLIDWCGIMAHAHGGVVWEGGIQWDWGQAMCRAAYGSNWMRNPGFLEMDETPASEPAPAAVVKLCQQWEAGEWPEWCTNERGRS